MKTTRTMMKDSDRLKQAAEEYARWHYPNAEQMQHYIKQAYIAGYKAAYEDDFKSLW